LWRNKSSLRPIGWNWFYELPPALAGGTRTGELLLASAKLFSKFLKSIFNNKFIILFFTYLAKAPLNGILCPQAKSLWQFNLFCCNLTRILFKFMYQYTVANMLKYFSLIFQLIANGVYIYLILHYPRDNPIFSLKLNTSFNALFAAW